MKARSSRKTSPLPSSGDGLRRPGRRGAATIVVLGLFVIFSSVGLGLAFLTQVALQAGRAKKNISTLEVLSENGVKREFGAIASLLAGRPFPLPLDEAQREVLLSDPASHTDDLIETALGRGLNETFRGGWDGHSWEGRSEFVPGRVEDRGSYVWAEYRLVISSLGRIESLLAGRSARLEAVLEMSAGSVPLSLFPALLDPSAGDGNPPQPFPPSSLVINPGPGMRHLARPIEAPSRLLPVWARPAMEKALDIELFRPQDLTAARLRLALGLEGSSEAVPEGVYLVRGDQGLGGVFVRGDLDELILAVDGDWQVVFFRCSGAEYALRFSPRRDVTEFASPIGREVFDSSVRPVIIVDGKIESLGGGRLDASGTPRLCLEPEAASILSGVRLTIVSTDTVTVSSHLTRQGVAWQPGLPYIRESDSELVIFSGGTGLGPGSAGGIVIAAAAPADLVLEAQLVSAGSGLRVLGPEKTVRLLGSVQASRFELNESRLIVDHDPGPPAGEGSDEGSLGTDSAVLVVSSFKPASWSDDEDR